jgi:hypothetical protein
MIDEFRRGAAFGAERLAGRMRGIGFEAGEGPVFHDHDGAAPGDAEPAVAASALRAGVISPRIFSLSSKACSIRPYGSMSESAFSQPTRRTRFLKHAETELIQHSGIRAAALVGDVEVGLGAGHNH